MKNLLFVMPSMDSGGGERSLLTLLSLTDYSKYSVSLFLFKNGGLFFDMLPKEVKILPHSEDFDTFSLPLGQSVKAFLKKGKAGLALERILFFISLRSGEGTVLRHDQRAWKHLKKAFGRLEGKYDAAIAYLEGAPGWMIVDCADADKKIAYVHNDYRKLGLDPDFDRRYFSRLDSLVTVSDTCAQALKECFPDFEDKVKVIENITSPAQVRRFAAADAPEIERSDCAVLLTVGRLNPQKGFDMAVEAARILKESGSKFRWYVLGEGELREEIERNVKVNDLEDCFILLGNRANPYPYIAKCDVYVQPSRYEGKSIALDEAKCLQKPIVATRFSTVADQLTDGVTAVITDISAEGVAGGIKKLLDDPSLANILSDNLAGEKIGNEEEKEKFYSLTG